MDRILPPRTVEATPSGAPATIAPWVWTVTPRLETRAVQVFATVTTPEGRVYPALRAVPGVGESSFDPGGPVRIAIRDAAGRTVVDVPFPGSEQRVGAGEISGAGVTRIAVELRMFGEVRQLTWTVETPVESGAEAEKVAAAPEAVKPRSVEPQTAQTGRTPPSSGAPRSIQPEPEAFRPEPMTPTEDLARQAAPAETPPRRALGATGDVPQLAGGDNTVSQRTGTPSGTRGTEATGPFIPDVAPAPRPRPTAPEPREGPRIAMEIAPRTGLASGRRTMSVEPAPTPPSQPAQPRASSIAPAPPPPPSRAASPPSAGVGRTDGRWSSWTPGAPQTDRETGGPVSLAPGSDRSAATDPFRPDRTEPTQRPSQVRTAALPPAQSSPSRPSAAADRPAGYDSGTGVRDPATASRSPVGSGADIPRPLPAPWTVRRPSTAAARSVAAREGQAAWEPRRPMTPEETSRTIEQLLSGASGSPVQVPPRRTEDPGTAPAAARLSGPVDTGVRRSERERNCSRVVYTYACTGRPAFGEEADSITFSCDRDMEDCCDARKSRVARLCGDRNSVKTFDCGCS
ncbi:MAG: hypothetical protein ACFB6R_08410 [Alphaproteobacteria bacterium]